MKYKRIVNTYMDQIENRTYKDREIHPVVPINENGKPQGLWYSLNHEWHNYWEEQGNGEYLFKNDIHLEVDLSQILQINSTEKMANFHKCYCTIEKDGFIEIDWRRVKAKWKGIEIRHPRKHFWLIESYSGTKERFFKSGRESMYLYGWDVSSGCIWDLSAIKNYEVTTYKRGLLKNED